MTDAYFEQLDENRFRPTGLTQGAWAPDEQHVSVLIGLVAHVLQQHAPRPELRLARLTTEILGRIPIADLTASVRTTRPGRTIELLEAEVTAGERTILQARAWRLLTADTADVAGLELGTMPPPAECAPTDAAAEWEGRFLTTLDYRVAPGGREGRRQVWARSDVELLAGQRADPLATYLSLVDLANGIATRMRPTQLLFPNVELSIHLLREPDPAWTGLDTGVSFGAEGIGLTSTTLHDVLGPVGRAEQCLTLRRIA